MNPANDSMVLVPVPDLNNTHDNFVDGMHNMLSHLSGHSQSLTSKRMALREQTRWLENLYPFAQTDKQKEMIIETHKSIDNFISNLNLSKKNNSVTWSVLFYPNSNSAQNGGVVLRLWDGVYKNDLYSSPLRFSQSEKDILTRDKNFAMSDMRAVLLEYEMNQHCTFSMTSDGQYLQENIEAELAMAVGDIDTADFDDVEVPDVLPALSRIKTD